MLQLLDLVDGRISLCRFHNDGVVHEIVFQTKNNGLYIFSRQRQNSNHGSNIRDNN
jgi:hypothetical protein